MLFGRTIYRAIALAAIVPAFSLAAHSDSLDIKIADGKVHGKALNSAVRGFEGIPYAAPPTGSLRWKDPQPVKPWSGVFDATKYGPHCAQGHFFDDMVFQDNGMSEDCLSLNVFTPANATAKSKLPVMFWIHGGGYTGGGANEPRHNGDFMPQKGVVLVTINYRLGVFGFLATPDLVAEQGGTAGNYGMKDMVAALQWVKKNIASFGGDPGNVTIFGESAGSFAVSTLMAVPSAQGLFHKAIGESGGALSTGTLSMPTLAEIAPKNEKWGKDLGANSLAELRALPVDKIIGSLGGGTQVRFSPILDGKFITEPIVDTYNAGRQAKVPLLAGFNRDEGFYLANGMTVDKWKAMGAERFPDKIAEFFKVYPATSDTEAVRTATDFGGDAFIAYGTWKWIEVDRRTGNKDIYRYKLDLAAPPSKFHPGSYAFHSDDIEYIFGTIDTRPGAVWREEDRVLSDQMMSYWTNFAKKGDPNGKDGKGQPLPTWPKYGEGDPVLHLDNPITSRPDENRARYEFWLNTEKK